MIPIKERVADFFADYPERTYTNGQLLIRAEEDPTQVFYLMSGEVVQYDISPQGNEVAVNVYKPFAFFPMSSAINRTPNHYFFEARGSVTVRQAPADAVVAFLQREPDIAFDLLSRVYRGLDGVLRRMAHAMGGDAKSRLLFELINAAYRFGRQQTDGSIFIPLSESEFARRSGLSRETINRNLREFREQGTITAQDGGVLIQSVAALEAALGLGL